MTTYETPRDGTTGQRLCEHCQETPVPESLGTKPRRYCSRNCRQRAYEARKTREAIVTAVAVAVARDRRTSRDAEATSRDTDRAPSRDVLRAESPAAIPAPAPEPVARPVLPPLPLPAKGRRRSEMTAAAIPLAPEDGLFALPSPSLPMWEDSEIEGRVSAHIEREGLGGE
ncbi:hypothetical protein ACFXPT_38205 [Streptomyces goshikiensis]|uniref:hypothetical protein n=1 Tax=Streptomyces goshikiensis TaxID=1942 RepID=UPI003677985B